ncbi:hypothetical protein [Streptomyces sp. NPDC050504]|uniref:hypothetical protein n=1 Tax=Streptomyces sp. NPDC050504 TaxID=3365618 RepID=UPI00379CBA35
MSVSALSLALLLTTAAATAVGVAALHAAHGLRKQVTALREDLAVAGRDRVAEVPAARATPVEEIRAAVADALAEERERELAEARAFWAAQETRDAAETPMSFGGFGGFGEETPFFLPRQADFAGVEALDLGGLGAFDGTGSLDGAAGLDGLPVAEGIDELTAPGELPEFSGAAEFADDSPELAAARRRHPSHPDFVPVQTPVVTDHERTVSRLEQLARTRTELADVRPGPLGTLDVYVFADGTTLCMTPGHRETAERLAQSLRDGEAPVLLGGSGVSGAYALTFEVGEESVYILADRVIASF